MRYAMPHFPCEFEVPDDWISEAGMTGFVPSGPAFRSTPNAQLIPLADIEPVYRFVSHPKDWRGFSRERLVRVLHGIATGAEIEAVPLVELLPVNDYSEPPYRYRIRNGYHRFFASIAAGFTHLPSSV